MADADRATQIALVMEGKKRARRKPWTVVQPIDPMELYRFIHEQFFGPPRGAHFPGRTQSTTDLMKYYAAISPRPHPGLAKRFRRFLNRFNPWKCPRPTIREKERLTEASRQGRLVMEARLALATTVPMETYESTVPLDDGSEDDDDIEFDQLLLTTRILELEQEIQNYKEQNEKIAELRETLEEEQKELGKSRRAFNLIRDKTFEIISEKKQNIRREREHVRQVALELGKALDKKNAEDQSKEIQLLRQKVTEVQDDLRRRTKRWTKTSQKLQTTIQQLRNEKRNLERVLLFELESPKVNGPSTSKPSMD